MAIYLRIEAPVCIGCGVCVESCPLDVIRTDAESRKAYVAYAEDCQACFLCVMDCPVEAIALTQDRLPRVEIGVGWVKAAT